MKDAKLFRLAGTNWARNHSNILKWCEAVSAFINISKEEYDLFTCRRTALITTESTRLILEKNAANMTLLLDWISDALSKLKEDERTPDILVLENPDLQRYRSAWCKHAQGEMQSLIELGKVVEKLKAAAHEQQQSLHDEVSDEFSSYSDYSETETESDEEDEEDEEEDDEKDSRKKRYDREADERSYRDDRNHRNRDDRNRNDRNDNRDERR